MGSISRRNIGASAALTARRDTIVDFRLVQTGRLRGTVWLDLNGNGQPALAYNHEYMNSLGVP